MQHAAQLVPHRTVHVCVCIPSGDTKEFSTCVKKTSIVARSSLIGEKNLRRFLQPATLTTTHRVKSQKTGQSSAFSRCHGHCKQQQQHISKKKRHKISSSRPNDGKQTLIALRYFGVSVLRLKVIFGLFSGLEEHYIHPS